MNRPSIKHPFIAVGLLALAGAVAAQTYYTHELVRRVAAEGDDAPAVAMQAPAAGQWDPWTAMHADMMRMQAGMDRFFDHGHAPYHRMRGNAFMPVTGQVTLEEQDGNYLVKADVPGAKEGDIDVKLDGRLLSISSQSQGQEKQTADNGQVTRREQYSSAFQQAFTLPGPVNASGMHSQFKDGVLTVTIPKANS